MTGPNTITQDNKQAINDFLKITLRKLMNILSAECGSLFLFNAEKKELVLDSFYNSGALPITHFTQKIGEGITGKVADIKKAVLVKDLKSDIRFKKNGFKHYRTDSFISIPLVSDNKLLGIMNIADKSSGLPFDEKDLNFAETICQYACLAAEHLLQSDYLKEEKAAFDKHKVLLEKYASVGKLAAGIVHEVNNPLDGIIRYTNMLLEKVTQESVVREYLLEIKKGLHRIANTTKSLLEFSSQVNSTAPKTKIYTDIRELINDSLDIFHNRMHTAVKIDNKIMENLPRVLDFGLSHVVVNIIKNAFDAMPDGGRLEIEAKIIEEGLNFSFKDSGVGIPPDIKEEIFEPFFTTKSIDKGTGLGLSICKEVINKYDGKIRVESKEGTGTTFTVFIPKKYLENA